jgi:LPS export ABC transporter protein LptC
LKKNIFVLFLLTGLLAACNQKEVAKPVEYEGPLREGADMDVLYTEDEKMKAKMLTKKILEYKNGDREFPEGIYIEFYDSVGMISSTLKANQAFYFREENKWRGRGDVEVRNIPKKQQLDTEELFWMPATKKIFTEKFVTIKLESEVLYGIGLDAAQDLSYYNIKDPKGEITVKE